MVALALVGLLLHAVPHAAPHAAPHTAPGALEHAVWQHEQRLDRDGVVVLRWNSTGLGRRAPTADSAVLVLEVAARTRGYVGLGLSPYTGTMAGADLVLAWVDDAGVPHARDYWADQNGSPTLDKNQDWRVVAAEENDTHTVVRLARPLHTQHVMDVQIQPGPVRVIFSWSGADPGRAPHYHGKEQRGVTEVCLLASAGAAPRTEVWVWLLVLTTTMGLPFATNVP
ncbi:DBH-like monooxygenase protein 1 [Frankliniella occidentalis]|uniref:DBH-like monooxygenase protein 1 n=1 Tax=Frankliniella occidentalis TaxID=133901 RepID=A0A9C6U1H6_FRAOC|nr:DBH-like monooxygenase protein 1 [Frankliniella occidentalis]